MGRQIIIQKLFWLIDSQYQLNRYWRFAKPYIPYIYFLNILVQNSELFQQIFQVNLIEAFYTVSNILHTSFYFIIDTGASRTLEQTRSLYYHSDSLL